MARRKALLYTVNAVVSIDLMFFFQKCTGVGSAVPHLCSTAQALLVLTGSYEQQIAVLVNLVVKATGQADLSTLLINAEQAAGVDEQAVADRLLLERQRWGDQKPEEEQDKNVTMRKKESKLQPVKWKPVFLDKCVLQSQAEPLE